MSYQGQLFIMEEHFNGIIQLMISMTVCGKYFLEIFGRTWNIGLYLNRTKNVFEVVIGKERHGYTRGSGNVTCRFYVNNTNGHDFNGDLVGGLRGHQVL